MKKLIISMLLVFGVMSVVFAKDLVFDPTPTPLERNQHENYSDEVYTFTGNSWKFTRGNFQPSNRSGLFTYTKNKITLYVENGKKFWNGTTKYEIIDNAAINIFWSNGEVATFLKQPFEFVTSGEMFEKIQGVWAYSKDNYNFSGNQFSYFSTKGKSHCYEGTFEVTNNGLIKLTTSKGIAYLYFLFPTDNKIRLDYIGSYFVVYSGTFNKQ
jgi:hypothetical protein